MQRSIRAAPTMLLIAFVMNFLWEIVQSPLYAPHYSDIAGLLLVHFRAGVGDVLLILIVLMLDTYVFSSFLGTRTRWWRLAALGVVLAILVEKLALASGRWSYGPWMPLIPLLQVGISPVAQMTLMPPLAARVWELLSAHQERGVPRV